MLPRLRPHKRIFILLAATWGAYFTLLFSRMIALRLQGLVVANENVWSDWAIHIALANIFALKPASLWFAYHPLYAGGALTYPFLANLISAVLMRAGFSLPLAFILPSIVTAFGLLLGMYTLWYLLLRSSKQAYVALSLFLLSSGLGFISFLRALPGLSAQNILVPAVYSKLDGYEWYTGNIINGMLLPQRAFLLGMTLAVWVLVVVIYLLRTTKLSPRHRWLLVGAGLMAGVLPIAHMHSFIVLVLVSACMFATSWRKWQVWLWYGVPAALLSQVLYGVFVYGGIENPHFMSIDIGWTAHGVADWLHQWWWQWGLAPFVGLLGWCQLRKQLKSYEKAFFLAFALLFIFANIILFQPTHWDNSKMFAWVYFALSGLMSAGLAWLWRQKLWRSATIILALSLTLSGALEVLRVQTNTAPLVLSSPEEINLAQEIRMQTDPPARFLTAPVHNHLVSMWAVRPILMGYAGWIHNYGFLYEQRLSDLRAMYAGNSATPELLKKYQISYVVIGPPEFGNLTVNQAYFAAHYPVAFSSTHYVIYDVR